MSRTWIKAIYVRVYSRSACSVREGRPPAESLPRFTCVSEIPTGAAQVRGKKRRRLSGWIPARFGPQVMRRFSGSLCRPHALCAESARISKRISEARCKNMREAGWYRGSFCPVPFAWLFESRQRDGAFCIAVHFQRGLRKGRSHERAVRED